MKITISVKGQKDMEVLYNENEISIKGEIFATYTRGAVTYSRLKSNIGYLYRESGETVGISTVCKYSFKTDVYNHHIICSETKQIVACYEGKPTGAIASFIAYLFYLSKQKKEENKPTTVKQSTVESKLTVQKDKVQKENLKSQQPSKEVIIPKKPLKEFEVKQEECVEPPKYEPPKYETPSPKIPIPSGGGSNSGNSSTGCLWVILGALAIYSAIKIIP